MRTSRWVPSKPSKPSIACTLIATMTREVNCAEKCLGKLGDAGPSTMHIEKIHGHHVQACLDAAWF